MATGDKIKALHARRLVMARLGPGRQGRAARRTRATPTGETVISKLFNVLAPRYADRQGGYTRIMKLTKRRLGDAGETAFIELLKEGETRVRASEPKPAAAPAPAPAPAGPGDAT